MTLTDTHAHLYWPDFKQDFGEILQRAKDTGVTNLINVGVDVEKSKEALKQVKEVSWPEGFLVRSTVGIHPHEAVNYINSNVSIHDDTANLEQLYLSAPESVVAIGECGLDFVEVDEQTKKLQTILFQAQIDLAKKLNLPLIVHCRDDRSKDPQNSEAWGKILEMLGNYPTVLHCYSGLLPTTKYLIHNTNFYVSFAATLTYPRNDYLREAARLLPIDRIVLETDSPFLPPQSKRGKRNEPANIVETAKALAEIKNLSLEEVANQTTKNAFVILNLKD